MIPSRCKLRIETPECFAAPGSFGAGVPEHAMSTDKPNAGALRLLPGPMLQLLQTLGDASLRKLGAVVELEGGRHLQRKLDHLTPLRVVGPEEVSGPACFHYA